MIPDKWVTGSQQVIQNLTFIASTLFISFVVERIIAENGCNSMFRKLNTLHLILFLNLDPYSMQDEKQKTLITFRLYLEEACFYFFLVFL